MTKLQIGISMLSKKGQNLVLFSIKTAFIATSMTLLFSPQSWGQNCAETEISSKIEQFKNDLKVKAALDAVVKCEQEAIAPLELALSESEAAIRASAASALGKIGIPAQDTAPALVAALADSEEVVRISAATALIQIGEAVRKQEIDYWDLEALPKLESLQQKLVDAQTKLKADKRDWASKKKDIDELLRVSNGLQTKVNKLKNAQPYQISQWLKGNPWAWVAAGGIVVYLGLFIFDPIFLLKLDKWFKPASFKIPWLNPLVRS